MSGGAELPAARRELALHPDGSIRSVQIQVQTTVSAGKIISQVRIGETPTTAALSLVAVSTTLHRRRRHARPAGVGAAAGGLALGERRHRAAGPRGATLGGTALDAWDNVCDYANHDVTQFLALAGSKDVWLYDRGTAMYRGYARRGDLRRRSSRRIARPRSIAPASPAPARRRESASPAAADLKYHYTQNLAIHYLLTGDDRFRETAEDVASVSPALWTSPGYAGGSDFWTERHAGFGLLAYVWARHRHRRPGGPIPGRSPTTRSRVPRDAGDVPGELDRHRRALLRDTGDRARRGLRPWAAARG